jgi:glycerol-3-phosphate acyltransferase PlsY
MGGDGKLEMSTLIWTALAFLAGSVPFSVWMVRLLLDDDVRRYGDGNPGATNAWKAGGWRVGLPALLLDYLKGAVPVGLAHFAAGLSGWSLVPVALAPVAGHAFSPFLRFRGGKALAVTFGVWTFLTLGEGPTVLGLLFALWLAVLSNDAWAVMLGMLGLLAYLLLRSLVWPAQWQDLAPYLLVMWGGNLLILAWKQGQELRQPVRLRPWLVKRAGRHK